MFGRVSEVSHVLKPSKEKELAPVGWKSISNRGNVQCCAFRKCYAFKDTEEEKNLAFLRNQGGLLWFACGETGSKHNQAKSEVPAGAGAHGALEAHLPQPDRYAILAIRSQH